MVGKIINFNPTSGYEIIIMNALYWFIYLYAKNDATKLAAISVCEEEPIPV